jgi:nicotinate-nucleotide--dimethylbenzimidazole phosphoribosyltransferase
VSAWEKSNRRERATQALPVLFGFVILPFSFYYAVGLLLTKFSKGWLIVTLLEKTLTQVIPVNRELLPLIEAHLNNLIKPHGSLGRLEDIAARYCLICGNAAPQLGRKAVVCFAADHGVAAEGVSAYPANVTPQMVRGILNGDAAVSVLARHADVELLVVDTGVNDPMEGMAGLLRHKVAYGTRNMAQGPAMEIDEARRALEVGILMADEVYARGVRMVATGDMGIANTTAAAALCAAYLQCDPDKVTGRGTGIDETQRRHKLEVVRRALSVNSGSLDNPLTTLAALGGLEIAGICGLVLGAAARRMAVVVDGFISTASALAAVRLVPAAADYLFFGHQSHEQGHSVVLDALGAKPILNLGMRLGEGTGAVLAMQIIEAAVKTYLEMGTFDGVGVSLMLEK